MLKERRRGRPPQPFVAAGTLVTARIRRLVDDVHGGNLLAASAYSGVPYAVLRDIHSGRGRSAGAATLERLAMAYDLPVDWFTRSDVGDDGTIPSAGWVGFIPGDSSDGSGGQPARPVTIPGAAWPLIRVLSQLEARLTAIPPSPGRPIMGTATDPRVCRGRLTAFILQPIASANLSSELSGPAGRGAHGGPSNDQWIEMLKALGRFWEQALGGLM
jgi:hypothetical protein